MELVQGHEIDEFSESKYFRKIKKLRKTNRFEICWIISKLRRPEILCPWDTRIEYYFICMPAARRDGVRSITRTLQCASLWELRVIRLTCSAAASTAERSCGALAWRNPCSCRLKVASPSATIPICQSPISIPRLPFWRDFYPYFFYRCPGRPEKHACVCACLQFWCNSLRNKNKTCLFSNKQTVNRMRGIMSVIVSW